MDASEPSATTSAAHRVYTELRTRLLSGEFPAGSRMVEERLAEEFSTSRTPVREALRRLEGDGHLVRGPGSGLRPAIPNVASMDHYYEVRLAIEDLAVRSCARGDDREPLVALRDRWRSVAIATDSPRDGPDFVFEDESFHQTLAAASGNPIAEHVLRDVNAHIRILRIHDFTSADRIQATIAEHLEIVEAILEGDGDAASAFMRAHVQRSALVVRERVARAIDRMADG